MENPAGDWIVAGLLLLGDTGGLSPLCVELTSFGERLSDVRVGFEDFDLGGRDTAPSSAPRK